MGSAFRVLVLSFAAAGVLSTAAAASTEIGPPLPAPLVGVPVEAPPPLLVDGQPPELVQHLWQRCRRYPVLVKADGPAVNLHLDLDVADGAIWGEMSGARRFDGIDDAVAIVGGPDVSGTKPYTLELWARPAFGIDSRYRFLVSRGTTTTAGRQGTGIWLSSAGLGFERWTNGVKAGVTYAAGLPEGDWSAVTATYDGAYMRLFVNGRQLGSRATTTPLLATSDTFQVGAGAGGRSGFFRGDLDELSLYGHALTRSHVAAHATTAVTVPCTQILNADGPTYTPTIEDLGDSLRVITNSTRFPEPGTQVTATSISESEAPTDENGLLVHPTILTPAAGTLAGTVQITASVAGLPIDRIEFLVDGVVRYAKGEAPYQYTWNTTAGSNGAHSVEVRAFAAGNPVPAVAQRDVYVSN